MRSGLRLLALLFLAHCMTGGPATASPAASGSATIYWTAPGDDSLVGRATAYDLRYSTTPITGTNFGLATRATGVPAPKPAGSAESFAITNLTAGAGYYFALKTVDEASNWSGISNVVFTMIGTASAGTPLVLWLSPPWPNPARSAAYWSYSLPQAGPLLVDAFDLAGRHVRSIERSWKAAGQGEATWDLHDDGGRSVAPGVYLVRATVGGRTWVKRLVVTR